jgi:hypothetical protein
MKAFKEELEVVFVKSDKCLAPPDILPLLHLDQSAAAEDQETFTLLKDYVANLSGKGKFKKIKLTYLNSYYAKIGCEDFLQYCTASRRIPPIGFSIPHITVSIVRGAEGICSSTCFHTLTLPPFSDVAALASVLEAVTIGTTFSVL